MNINPQGRAPNGAEAPSPGQVTTGSDTLGGDGYPHGALKGQKPNTFNTKSK